MPATAEETRNAEGNHLLELAERLDSGEAVDVSELSNVESAQTTTSDRAAVPKEKETTPDPSLDPDKSKTPADEAGTKETDSQTRGNQNDRRRQKEGERAAPGFSALRKAEEAFEAAQAERERKFEAMVAEFRQSQAEPQQRQQQQARQPDISQMRKVNRGKDANGNEYTAEDYFSIADEYEADDGGVTPRVVAARKKAREIQKEDRLIDQAERQARTAPQQSQANGQPRMTPQQLAAHTRTWDTNRDALLAAEPDLKTDRELSGWVQSVLKDDDRTTPEIKYLCHAHPNGFQIAARIGKALRDASLVPALQSDKARLEAENAKYKAKLGIGGDQTAGDPGAEGGVPFEKMTGPQQAAWLEKQAEIADAQPRRH